MRSFSARCVSALQASGYPGGHMIRALMLVMLERALLGEVTERTEHTTVVRFESEQDAIDTITRAQQAIARRGLGPGKIVDTTAKG